MNKILILTEKPSVAEDIAKVLNAKRKGNLFESDKYTIIFALGHLVTLCEPEDYDKKFKYWTIKDLPIIPKVFKLKPIRETEDQFDFVKKFLKSDSYDFIVNACDAGREGELIFRYIYKLSKSNLKIKRLWLNALTKEEILNGFNNLKDGEEFENLGIAAEARAQADWLVGINATRAFTRKEGLLLSIGRVQTPTLYMIVERENEILSFKKEKYYEIFAYFEKDKFKYKGKWFDDSDDRIFDENKLIKILENIKEKDGLVDSIELKKNKVPPPLLYDLTELQREANRLFGFTAQKTLSIAQSLYEQEKLITYPRTDSRYLPSSLKSDIPKILKNLSKLDIYKNFIENVLKSGIKFNSRIVDDSKVTDHFAIIPTGVLPKGMLSNDKKIIFDLIVKRFISVFYPPAEELKLTIITKIVNERFKTDDKYLIFSGWMKVYGKEEELFEEVPLKIKEKVKVNKIEKVEKFTEPPPRFTDGGILSLMETCGKLIEDEELREILKEKGIGTPATRAQIIERLIEVGYIERDGKYLKPLPKGMKLIETLKKIPLEELLSPELTGEWERKLLFIEKGKLEYEKFIKDIINFTKDIVDKVIKREGKRIKDEIVEVIGKCPNCNSELLEGERGYFCKKFKEKNCLFYVPKTFLGRKISREEVLELVNNKKTKLLYGFISKNKKKFSAYLFLGEDGKVTLSFPEDKVIDEKSLGKCPICGSNVLETETKFKCENDNCSFSINKFILGKEIKREDMIELLGGRETKIFQFKSKGKKFKAQLKLEKDKLKFIFEEKGHGKSNSKKSK
ncbi:MAG: DNA topoisomerase 3 [Caldisericia bacterium]|nr:DNA topoisomerase 3 [Caldisericia bacterium]